MEEQMGPQMPPVDEPFTTADSLQLQKLNQALAGLTSQVNDGILYPDEADPEKKAMMQERQGLLARQQQAQTAQRGQQRMHQQDEIASQQAIQIANGQNTALNFTSMMPLHVDPKTGDEMYFYPVGDGKFAPVPPAPPKEPAPWEQFFSGGEGQSSGPDTSSGPPKLNFSSDALPLPEITTGEGEAAGPGGGRPAAPAPLPAFDWFNSPTGASVLERAKAEREHAAATQAAQPQVEPPKPNPDGTHTMTVWNGPNRTDVTYDQSGKAVNTTGSWKGQEGGRPPAQAGAQSSDALGMTAQDHAQAAAQAKQMVPPPFLTGNRAHDGVTMAKYNHDLARAQQLITLDTFKRRQDLAHQATIDARIAKADELKQAAEKRKAVALGDTTFKHEYTKHFDDLQKQINKFREGKTDADVAAFAADPANAGQEWMWDREAHKAKAKSLAEGATFSKYGERGWTPQDERKAAAAPAQASPAATPAASKPPPVDVSLKELLAEKARRDAEKVKSSAKAKAALLPTLEDFRGGI